MKTYVLGFLGLVCFAKVQATGSEEEKMNKTQKILLTEENIVYSRECPLSEQAVEKATKIMEKIKSHPYNVELAKGTLPYKTFSYYLCQDYIFLKETWPKMALLASKVPLKHRNFFLTLANHPEYQLVFKGAQGMFESFMSAKNADKFVDDSRQTLALHAYVDFMCSAAAHDPIEAAVAAFIPCPWVYATLAHHFKPSADPDGVFYGWIERYTASGFTYVDQMLKIFDDLAQHASDEVRSRMVDNFVKGVALELALWDDAYHSRSFLLE